MLSSLKHKRCMLLCVVSTFALSFICHGYRYLNLLFSGDATLISQTGEELYQISLGRFLQPIWWRIRGPIVAPFLIGLFTICFLSISAYILSELLQLKSPLSIVLICGLLTSHETIGIANATYLSWSDVYTVSLFFSLLGAKLSLSKGHVFLLTPLCYIISLGLYQSYITCAATIIVIVLLCDCLENRKTVPEIWALGLRSCLLLFFSLLFYALVLKTVLLACAVTASTDYNGVGRVGLVSIKEFLPLIKDAYLTPIRFLFNPSDRAIMPWHISCIPVWINCLFLGFILALVLLSRLDKKSALTACFLLSALPLAANFVMIISKGVLNGLMIYAWSFLYLIPIALTDNNRIPFQIYFQKPALILASLLILMNSINCNQLYIKRDLEFSATQSAFTRILGRMETTESYIPGVTPVVVSGMLPSSTLSMNRNGFDNISKLQGMRYTYSAAYETSEYWYLTMILGAKINLVSHEERVRLIREYRVDEEMERYPADSSIQMVDGKLFIRF